MDDVAHFFFSFGTTVGCKCPREEALKELFNASAPNALNRMCVWLHVRVSQCQQLMQKQLSEIVVVQLAAPNASCMCQMCHESCKDEPITTWMQVTCGACAAKQEKDEPIVSWMQKEVAAKARHENQWTQFDKEEMRH